MRHEPPTSAMNRLVARLCQLPGIGKRSAERLAFYLLKQPAQEAAALAAAITDLKQNMQHCSICFNLTESDPCAICQDPQRNHRMILVVEQPSDVAIFEAAGTYRGVYHVLMGRLSPLDGIGPGELNIAALLNRAQCFQTCDHRPCQGQDNDPGSVDSINRQQGSPFERQTDPAALTGDGVIPPAGEVILGLSPTLEGDGTALYLAQQFEAMGMTVTRLARGLPTGSNLELVSKAVLSDAIEGRRTMTVD